jgi:predicted nucleotidyltransferase
MSGLDVIDGRLVAVWERAREVLGADERVKAVELGGSVASGTADEWSDLDFQVIAHADRFDELLADWPRWLEEITPTVFARTPIAPFIVNAITADGLTVDVVIFRGEAITFPPATDYVVGSLSHTRFAEIGDALEYAVAEQLRGMAGPFVSLVRRHENLRQLAGIPHLLGLLTTVFLAELGAPPPGKLWNATYTDEQLAAVAALPPVSANDDDMVAFSLALAELVIRRARPLFDRYGLTWPTALAEVAARRLHDALGIDASPWLSDPAPI